MSGSHRGPHRLVIVQIDGLAKPTLDRFMSLGRTPALRRLAMRDDMRMVSVFAGVPSTTACAQAELFYGVRQAVPAFLYREGGRTLRRMIEPASASAVQARIEKAGPNLLSGGSAYGNIYSGGAEVTRYCPVGVARREFGDAREVARSIATYSAAGVRAIGMLIGEVGRVVVRGYRSPGSVAHRVMDARNRIVASIVVRDSSTNGVVRDMRRGVPVVHVNYFGYDKQAHRYGPESAPARRALQGIDKAVGRVARAALLDGSGPWTVVVYSDHGQERVVPVRSVVGRGIEEIVRSAAMERGVDAGGVSITQSGAIGHVYIEPRLASAVRGALAAGIARRLVHGGAIVRMDDGAVMLWAGDVGPVSVRDARRALSGDHPFPEDALADLESLAGHPDAGDIVLVATGMGERSVTFESEHGSHGGPGALETHAFALVPRSIAGAMEALGAPLRLGHLRAALVAMRSEAPGP